MSMDDNQKEKSSVVHSVPTYSTAIATTAMILINWLANEEYKQPLLLLSSALSPLLGSFIFGVVSSKRKTDAQDAMIKGCQDAINFLETELQKEFYSDDEKQKLKDKRTNLVLELADIRKMPSKYVIEQQDFDKPV